MSYLLLDLDELTRQHMLEELESDVAAGTVLTSTRALPGTEADYVRMLREAFATGTPDSLVGALETSGIWAAKQRDGKVINVPESSKVLGDGQFVVYYSRALCIRSIAEGREVEIYRGQTTTVHRSSSDGLIGTRPDPSDLLNELRGNSLNPWNFTSVGKPNSGIVLKLV